MAPISQYPFWFHPELCHITLDVRNCSCHFCIDNHTAMAPPGYKSTYTWVSGSFLDSFDWCSCISITNMTIQNNITQTNQEDWILDYPGALIILRDKRERRFRNMMSGVGDFKKECNAFEDL